MTYKLEDIHIMFSDFKVHTKIEKILEKYGLFMKDYESLYSPNIDDYMFKELEPIFLGSKYDIRNIVNLNNRVTKFVISLANSIKFGPTPISVSIDTELVEYILYISMKE